MKIETFEALIEQKKLVPIYMVVKTGNKVKWFLCIHPESGMPVLYDEVGFAYMPGQFPAITDETEFSVTTVNNAHYVNGIYFKPKPLFNL